MVPVFAMKKLVWPLFGIIYHLKVSLAVDCLKNEDLGEQPGNVYFCTDPSKTECCEKDMEFTCCEPASVTTLREQIILWGTIIVVLLAIILLVVCFKLDISYCSSDKTLKDKFLSLFRKRKKTKIQKKTEYDANLNPQSNDDREKILKSPAASRSESCQPTPEEIKDFNRHTTRRDSRSHNGHGTDLPLTARGVGVEFDRQEAWNS